MVHNKPDTVNDTEYARSIPSPPTSQESTFEYGKEHPQRAGGVDRVVQDTEYDDAINFPKLGSQSYDKSKRTYGSMFKFKIDIGQFFSKVIVSINR